IKGFRFNLVRLRCPEKNELIPFVIKFTRKNCFLITFISGKEILTALRIPVFKKPDIGLLKWQRVPNKVFATLNFDHGLFTRFVKIFIRSQPQLLGIYHIRCNSETSNNQNRDDTASYHEFIRSSMSSTSTGMFFIKSITPSLPMTTLFSMRIPSPSSRI